MKIIREVSKEDFEQTKQSKNKDVFEYHIMENKFYMVATKKDWRIFENRK